MAIGTTTNNGELISYILDPITSVTGILSFVDSIEGETVDIYFEKYFRYAIDGIHFTEFELLTDVALQAITTNVKHSYVFEIQYKRVSNANDELIFKSFNLIYTDTTVDNGYEFDHSNFVKFFDTNNVDVIKWALNVLNKIYYDGQLAKFLERNVNSNFAEDIDFIKFWKSIAQYFAYSVILARKYSEFYRNFDFLLEFLKQRGLIVCNQEQYENLHLLMNNFYDEIRRRGTIQIIRNRFTDDYGRDASLSYSVSASHAVTDEESLGRVASAGTATFSLSSLIIAANLNTHDIGVVVTRGSTILVNGVIQGFGLNEIQITNNLKTLIETQSDYTCSGNYPTLIITEPDGTTDTGNIKITISDRYYIESTEWYTTPDFTPDIINLRTALFDNGYLVLLFDGDYIYTSVIDPSQVSIGGGLTGFNEVAKKLIKGSALKIYYADFNSDTIFFTEILGVSSGSSTTTFTHSSLNTDAVYNSNDGYIYWIIGGSYVRILEDASSDISTSPGIPDDEFLVLNSSNNEIYSHRTGSNTLTLFALSGTLSTQILGFNVAGRIMYYDYNGIPAYFVPENGTKIIHILNNDFSARSIIDLSNFDLQFGTGDVKNIKYIKNDFFSVETTTGKFILFQVNSTNFSNSKILNTLNSTARELVLGDNGLSNSIASILTTTGISRLEKISEVFEEVSFVPGDIDGFQETIINGELLRAICYQRCDEFILNFRKKEKIGFNIGGSSPLYRGTSDMEGMNKIWARLLNEFDYLSYPLSDQNLITSELDNNEYAIKFSGQTSGVGFGFDNSKGVQVYINENYKQYAINVDQSIDYELTLKFKVTNKDTQRISIGFNAMDCNGRINNLINPINKSVSTLCIDSEELNLEDRYYFIRCIIYGRNKFAVHTTSIAYKKDFVVRDINNNFYISKQYVPKGAYLLDVNDVVNPTYWRELTTNEINFLFKTNWGKGNNLQFTQGVKKIMPYVSVEHDLVGDISYICNVQLKPVANRYSSGFIQTNNWIDFFIKNRNQSYSINKLKELFRRYLLPYDSEFEFNNLDIDDNVNNPVTNGGINTIPVINPPLPNARSFSEGFNSGFN